MNSLEWDPEINVVDLADLVVTTIFGFVVSYFVTRRQATFRIEKDLIIKRIESSMDGANRLINICVLSRDNPGIIVNAMDEFDESINMVYNIINYSSIDRKLTRRAKYLREEWLFYTRKLVDPYEGEDDFAKALRSRASLNNMIIKFQELIIDVNKK